MPRDVPVVLTAALLAVLAPAAAAAQPPQAASLSGLSKAVACAPSAALERTAPRAVILGGREANKYLLGPGDGVIVSAGADEGVGAGDEFFVRRAVTDRHAGPVGGKRPITIQTAGAVQIVEARQHVAIGIVTLACDGISDGDYLERFEPPVVPDELEEGTADHAAAARVVLGADRRHLGAAGDFMVLDRGTNGGLQAGQALTVFRRTPAGQGGPVATIGRARVYAVRPATATIRIESSVDAVNVGDLVAIHR